MKTLESYVGKWRVTHMNEWDQGSGRGGIRVNDTQMEGHIFFRFGDDSRSTAEKKR